MGKPKGYNEFSDAICGFSNPKASGETLHELCLEHTSRGHDCSKCQYFLANFKETTNSYEFGWRFFFHSKGSFFFTGWGKMLAPFMHLAVLQSDQVLPKTQELVMSNVADWQDGDANRDVLCAIAANGATKSEILASLIGLYAWLDYLIRHHPNSDQETKAKAVATFFDSELQLGESFDKETLGKLLN